MEKTKQYFKTEKDNILDDNLFERIRERLKLNKKQLSDAAIKKVCKLNNKLIGDWIVNNADGFQIKDNGRLIVSKYLPKILRGDKTETVEKILNSTHLPDYVKEMYKSRYEKSLAINYANKSKFINLHSFFYLYRIMWFNGRNCAFDKAELYEIKINKEIKSKLNEKIIEGKDYFEWNFTDFRLTRKKNKKERIELNKQKKLKKKNGSSI